MPKQVGVGHEGAAEPPVPGVMLHEGCCARGCGAEVDAGAGAGAVCGVCGAAVTSVGLCVGSKVGAQGQRGCRLWLWCLGLGPCLGVQHCWAHSTPCPPSRPLQCGSACRTGWRTARHQLRGRSRPGPARC